MPISYYGGYPIFGLAVKMTTNIAERDVQRTAYPSVTGVEHLDMGGRGRITLVTGIMWGATLADLIINKTALESFNDGVARAFYDSSGVGWRNVILKAPQFKGGYRSAGAGGFFWDYQVALEHLSQT